MKKFLTVLLALSVVFTYSFGTVSTVFAGTTAADQAQLEATAQKEELAEVAADAKAALVYDNDGYLFNDTIPGQFNVTGIANYNLVSRTVAEKVIDDVVVDYSKAIDTAANAVVKDGVYDAEDKDEIINAWKTAIVDKVGMLRVALINDKYLTALKAQFTEEHKAAIAYINAVNEEDYFDIDFELESGIFNESDAVKALKNTKEKAVKAVVLEDSDAVSVVAEKIKTVTGALADFKSEMKNVSLESDYATDNGYKTAAARKEALAKAQKEKVLVIEGVVQDFEAAARQHLQKVIANESTSAADLAAANAKLATLSEDVQNVKATLIDLVNSVSITEKMTPAAAEVAVDAPKINEKDVLAIFAKIGLNGDTTNMAEYKTATTEFYAAVDSLSGITNLIAYAESYAADLKTKYDAATGKLMYNAADVDEALASVIAQIKAGKLTNNTAVKTAMNDIVTALEAERALIAAKYDAINGELASIAGKTAFNGTAELTCTYPNENYDKTDAVAPYASLGRLDAIKAIKAKAIEAVKAATTVKQVAKIVSDAKDEMAKVLTDVNIAALIADGGNVANAYTANYKDLISAYAENYFVDKTAPTYRPEAKADAIDAAKTALYLAALAKADGTDTVLISESDAKAAMAAAYQTALDAFKGVKTDAELKEAESAVIAAIDAIDKVVTLDSKAGIETARKMYDAYADMIGSNADKITNSSVLEAAEDRLQVLENNKVFNAIHALQTKKITTADLDAVNKAQAMLDAYDDAYDTMPVANADALVAIKTALVEAFAQDATDKISQIPAVVTDADKATVEAARKAYDAYMALISDDNYYDALTFLYKYNNVLMAEKLANAENQLGVKNNDKLIAGVRGTSLKASSVAAKGSITVKWTKSKGYKVDYYEVFKSTKPNKGFGTKAYFTTKTGTAMTYKNTKELKKGTRYFFKVRGVRIIDGQKVYTKESNKAYRIAK